MRSALLALLSALIGLVIALAAVEAALRLVPALLPATYLDTLPLRGLALLDPDLARDTPLAGVPLPYAQPPGFYPGREYRGPAPSDLRLHGLVPAGPLADAARYPEVRMALDARGLPNPRALDHADILLVGDSFAFTGGVTYPPGLQATLAAESGAKVYNLGVPGTEPLQQRWLLRRYGAGLDPRAVIWLYFAGNDLDETERLLQRRSQGITSYQGLLETTQAPLSRLADVLKTSFASRDAVSPPGLGGVELKGSPNPDPIWFLPHYLRQLARAEGQWRAHPAWASVADTLAAVHDEVNQAGSRFLLVYVPTKAEVYLPHLEGQDHRLRAMAGSGGVLAADWSSRARAHRLDQQSVVGDFCRDRGIEFLTLAPAFERMAERGDKAYFSADTHWNPDGQRVAASLLAAWYRRDSQPRDQ